MTNSIRPDRLASHRWNGEAQTREEREARDAEGQAIKRLRERCGGWRRRASKARHVKRRDLRGCRGRVPVIEKPHPPRRSHSTHSSVETG
jgi:hypothetical protein